MALTSTMHRVQLNISDVDRGVYEDTELRVAQHPSESEPFLVARLLAWALELHPDLSMGRGISTPEDPTMAVRDPTGEYLRWVEVGVPSAERLHRISKAAPSVAVYAHKPLQSLLTDAKSAQVHRADALEVFVFPPAFLNGLTSALGRQCRLEILRTEGTLYVTPADGIPHETPLPVRTLAEILAEARG